MTRTSAPTIHRVLSASLAGALLLAAAGILFFSTAQPALAANPVVITVPTPGLQGGTQQLVQGTADPGDLITVDVTPVGEGTGCTATVDAAGNWVCLTTGLVTDPDLTFTATRNSGTAPPDLYQTTVSNILPPTIDGIVGGEITSSNPTPTITGTAYPGAAVHITVDNANPNVCTADGSGMYSCPWPADPPLATAPQDAGVGYPVAVY